MPTKRKNTAAVALGRRGGAARVSKGFGKLPAAERKRMATAAAQKRWGKPTARVTQ